ncbi:hypothetical protein A3Q56_06924 [Intoshia linei]|uniref:SUEL-type lectin domain-containing protein n=1 Tax=Intoshia linei TaxID=1819745 RepID=A0A177AVG1_9BILA|nr:hypothetical protein A3Q56_06924 [Intoshia linei]
MNFVIFGLSIFLSVTDSKQYCLLEKFYANCQPNLILIKHANFGRMSPGKCITAQNPASIGCKTDVIHFVDSICSGNQNCSFFVSDIERYIMNDHCQSIDYKSYLELTYRCLPVFFKN